MIRRSLLKQKRGQEGSAIGIILFVFVLFSILILGFIVSMVIAITGYGSGVITPIIQEIGVVGDTNVTQAANDSIVIANDFIQSLPWIMGFAYFATLAFSIIFAVSFKANPNPIYMGLYFMLMLLLIIGAIIMSNMYEDIYNGTDDIATELREQTMLSYGIIYSPTLFTIIGFITGIYVFAGRQDEEGSV